ncbi:MAG: c-type cytochrome [Anaerolineales bacterium]
MTPRMSWIAILSSLLILTVIPVYAWLEPERQSRVLNDFRTEAVLSATDHYAENCAVCHGASAEGLASNPPLNLDALRTMPADDLFKIIANGRYNTQMAAWSVESGGLFTTQQIADFVTLIQHGNWEFVRLRVAELGLTPPDEIKLEVTEEMLAPLKSLANGEVLATGLSIYAENCTACHNANASGSLIAPALDTPELRATDRDELAMIVNRGVPGTLMSAWDQTLNPSEVDAVLELILRWPEVVQAGVEFPEVQAASIPSSPERIAEGEQLFQVACKSCHGADAYGTPMAPALNNSIFLEKTPDAAIYQIIAGGVPGTLMPAWGSRLTDYDLQTLVAYLRSFEPTAPPVVAPIVQ